MFASSINSQLVFFVLICNRQLGETSELVFIVPSAHGTMGLQGRSTESLWKWDHGFTCFNQPTTQPTNQSTSINQSSTFHSLQLFGSRMRLATPAPATALQRRLRRSCNPSASIGALIFLAGLGVRRFSSVTSREHWMAAPFDGRRQVERAKKQLEENGLWFEARRKMTPQIWSCWRGKGIYEVRQKNGKAQFKFIYLYIYIIILILCWTTHFTEAAKMLLFSFTTVKWWALITSPNPSEDEFSMFSSRPNIPKPTWDTPGIWIFGLVLLLWKPHPVAGLRCWKRSRRRRLPGLCLCDGSVAQQLWDAGDCPCANPARGVSTARRGGALGEYWVHRMEMHGVSH